MGFGTEGHIRIARQNTIGQATTDTGSFMSVPFVNESLVLGIPDVVSDTIRGRFEEGPSVQGYHVGGGDIVFRPHPDTLGVFLYGAFGVCSSQVVGSMGEHTFTPTQTRYVDNLAMQPFTVEVYKGADEAHFFHDGQVNRFMLEIAPGQYLRGAANWMFRTHSTTTKTTPAFPDGLEFTWNQASITVGGVANVLWEQLTMTVDNTLQYVPALDGTKVFRRVLRNGFRTFRLTGTADFPNNDEFDKFKAGSEQAIDITVTGATLSSSQNEYLRIQIPNFRYETYPIAITGPTRITIGFTGRAIFNQGSGFSAKFMLQNSRASYWGGG